MRHITAGCLLAFSIAAWPVHAAPTSATVGGVTYTNHGLVAVGRMPANLRDSFGETFGSGSGMAFDPASWKRTATGYTGSLLLLPDRGYNVDGTSDYRVRVNRITIELTPMKGSLPPAQAQATLKATLEKTTLLTDERGEPMTGLDPLSGIRPAHGTFPALPQAANGRVSLDPEAIVLMPDGSMFISDEYGPNIYRYDAAGKLLSVTRPPQALIPMRNGHEDFASNNPGPGAAAPKPANPDFGRQNNQGLEGLARTPDGRHLIAILQSATRQDGGDTPETRRHTRALVYDMTDPAALKLVAEHVIPLPEFRDDKNRLRVAAQSEAFGLSSTTLLMLSRDSNNGYGQKGDQSLYRRIDLLDLAGATNIAGTAFDGTTPVAPKGKLDAAVKPATLSAFIDLNDTAELARFGLHNGAPNDRMNLSEKWEAISVASALDPAAPDDYFLFVANDNDFITQDGFQVGAAYKDDSGADVDTMFLVFKVTLPGLKK
jgi:hypothetical protein